MKRARSEASRITALFALVVAATGLIAGVGGFLLMQGAAEDILRGRLAQEFEHRAALIRHELEDRLNAGAAMAARPDWAELLADAEREPSTAGQLQRMLSSALEFNFISLTLFDRAGRELAHAGAPATPAALRVALPAKPAAHLAWNAGFELETRLPILDRGRQLGVLRLRQPLKEMTPVAPRGVRQAAAVGYCANRGGTINCFPGNGLPRPRERGPEELTSQMLRALDGEAGVVRGPDFRGVDVVAAYGSLPELGVGMSLRVETAALYAALRPQMLWLSALLAVLGGVVFLLLRAYVAPLLRRLAHREEQLRLALQATRLALWEYDAASGKLFLSEEWSLMRGAQSAPTTSSLAALGELVHPHDMPAVALRIRGALKGEIDHYDIEHRVLRQDGTWLWIRSRGEVTQRDARGRALRVVGTNADITQSKQIEQRIAHEATHDALTGLANRRVFQDRLEHALARARRHGDAPAVLYLDMDKFKPVNDTYGHAAGDELLKEFALRLLGCVRVCDTVARLGGDEFTVLLEDVGGDDAAHAVAEKIVAAMRLPFVVAGHSLNVSTSIGVARLHQADAFDAGRLLARADAALYAAKRAGRDRISTQAALPAARA